MSNVTASARNLVSYVELDAPMWKLDPRAKIIWVVVTIILSVSFTSPIPAFLLLLQTIVLSAILGYPIINQLVQHSKTLMFLVVFLGLLNILFASFVGGIPLFSIRLFGATFSITSGAVLYGATVTARVLTIFIAIIVLTSSTRMSHIVKSLECWGVPYRIAFLIGVTWRLIPLVAEGLEITMDSQRARGFEMDKGTFRQKLTAVQRTIKPIFILLANLTDDMSLAFVAKGLDFESRKRTSIWQPKLITRDWCIVVYSIVLLVFGFTAKLLSIWS